MATSYVTWGQLGERYGEWKMKTAYLIDAIDALNCN
jgi:hypothetical protein